MKHTLKISLNQEHVSLRPTIVMECHKWKSYICINKTHITQDLTTNVWIELLLHAR